MASDVEWCEELGLDVMSMEDATFIVNNRYDEAIRSLELHRAELKRLRRFNAQMLAALKKLRHECSKDGFYCDQGDCALCQADRAIAAAEEVQS